MMKKLSLIIVIICTGLGSAMFAQDTLTIQQMINMTLENNFQVKLSENAKSIAGNNNTVFNTNQLPVISMEGGGNYQLDYVNANFQDGRSVTVNAAETERVNLSLNVGYTVFDGFFRKNNVKQLQQQYMLSELQLQQTVQNVIAQALRQYFTVASLSKSKDILINTLELSRERVERTQSFFDYGQGSKLDYLNAKVDFNNDSLSLINAEMQLENAKRVLNMLMARGENIDYFPETDIGFFEDLDKSYLKGRMYELNAELALIDKNIEIGSIQVDLAKSQRLPSLDLNASYGINASNNNSASFLASQRTHGLLVGLTARWNIFDGGVTRTAIENARLNKLNLEIQKDQLYNQLELDFENAWANYMNAKAVFEAESNNAEIVKENFDRTAERFNSGQLNSLDFRQAQLNYINALNSMNIARYDVKITEVELLLLSGTIIK